MSSYLKLDDNNIVVRAPQRYRYMIGWSVAQVQAYCEQYGDITNTDQGPPLWHYPPDKKKTVRLT